MAEIFRISRSSYSAISLNFILTDDQKQAIFGPLSNGCRTMLTNRKIIKRCETLLKTISEESSFYEKVTLIKSIMDLSTQYMCPLAMVISVSFSSWPTELLFVGEQAPDFIHQVQTHVIETTKLNIQ